MQSAQVFTVVDDDEFDEFDDVDDVDVVVAVGAVQNITGWTCLSVWLSSQYNVVRCTGSRWVLFVLWSQVFISYSG